MFAKRALPLTIVLFACKAENGTKPTHETPRDETTKKSSLTRADFNRRAAEKSLPLFWVEDKNGNQQLDPDELGVLWRVAERRNPLG